MTYRAFGRAGLLVSLVVTAAVVLDVDPCYTPRIAAAGSTCAARPAPSPVVTKAVKPPAPRPPVQPICNAQSTRDTTRPQPCAPRALPHAPR